MTNQAQQDSSELLKRALGAIDQLQAKLAAAEAAQHEPIAIVGIGCRFPGAEGPEGLWDLLANEIDAVTEVPIERWDVASIFDPNPDASGKTYTKWGAFLDGIDMFDAPFFGITPREAASLDPQQRLLLEMSWIALEDAGIAPLSVANTRTGVYVGITGMDYVQMLARTLGPDADAYALSGTAHSIAGGRISYFLGAQGPNISLDTACSSSMVAIHLAAKALRSGEADLALAGGVNVTIIPDASILTSRARMMSPTGRCHAFDAGADGYVRAEGAAMITLKRLSDAQRDGDRILAVVRGSAINQDGRSSGLTAPHGPAQEEVIRAAHADARVKAEDITFVEAHGTGTALGDPIEVNALSNVFAGRPEDQRLLIGSVKANIGHTEGAAGIAGLIKAIGVMRNGVMPRQLHIQTLNPMINWAEAPVQVPLAATPLPATGKPLLCGVSSFGFSGTNAHIVVQAPPAAAEPVIEPHAADASTLLAISARTPEAVKAFAQRYVELLSAPHAPSLRQVAANAPLARSHFAERIGVVAADSAEAAEALRAFVAGEPAANVIGGRTLSGSAVETVFLFTGQGAQYLGMGKGLYESEPAFRAALDECDRLAAPHMERRLLDVMFGDDQSLLDDTTYTQPALFAVEYALAQTWRSWGVEPTAVMGHSVGEYTAACIAGMLSLEDAIRLIAARGRLMGRLPKGGAMAAAFASEDAVRAAIAAEGGQVSIAAVNGPTNIVISGAEAAVDAVLTRLKADGVDMQRLNVSHAFHSALMDPILDEFEALAATVSFGTPQITLLSNISGEPMGEEGRNAGYWRRHLREAVRFSDSFAHLLADGYKVFLEVGPAPVLAGMAQRCAPKAEAVYVASLRRGRDDRRSMLEAAAKLYAAGAKLDWPAFTGPRDVRTPLPNYPFQRTRFWQDETKKSAAAMSGSPTGHPLLGVRASSPMEIYHTEIGLSAQPWAKDHQLFEFTPFPASGFLELALAAARQQGGEDVALENISIGEGLLLDGEQSLPAQVVITQDPAGGGRTVQVYSAADPDEEDVKWRLHMSAQIRPRGAPTAAPLAPSEGYRAEDVGAFYARIGEAGAHYGPTFQGLRTMARKGGEVVAELDLPDGVQLDGYVMHPAMLDACFHPMGLGMEAEDSVGESTDLFMPVGLRRYAVFKPGAVAAKTRVVVAPREKGAKGAQADISVFDAGGDLIAELIGFEVHLITPASLQKLLRKSQASTDWRFKVEWQASAAASGDSVKGQNWLVFTDAGGVGEAFANNLRRDGATVAILARPEKMDEKALAAAVEKAAPIDRPLHGAALLWALDAPADADDLASLEAAHADLIASSLYGLRTVVDRAARVFVVTRGTQQVGVESANLVQAPLWAMAGVVASEHPTCGLARIDLDGASDPGEALFLEASLSDSEDRIAYREDRRFVARLTLPEAAAPVEEAPVELDIAERGSLGNLAFKPMTRRAPGPGEVEIRVFATGLNFRDVLNALGMYPGDPGPLGNECSGVVTAVGPGVTRLAVGDEVVGMVDRSFATYVIAPETMTVRKPTFVTHQQAATVPVTFLTADYALRALSRIKAGDRVLIHAVTGGVGMAATQIALRAGAIVYGTAGSPAKRALAKQLGVHYVSDSRSLDFVEDFKRDTNGEGVDIVLNSLAGEFIPASLDLLREGGRFVEIGKTDIWTTETVAKAYPGVEYYALYLGEVAAADPELVRSMLEGILADMDGGPLKPLPQKVYPLEHAEQAFRYMAQGLHVGKVVLTQQRPVRMRRDGAYVITGGLTGLGLTTARWLAEQGAGHVVLLGRRAPSAEALSAIAEIEATGTQVRTAMVDVGDATALAALLEDVRRDMAPIRGIMHAAGVLDDGMLSEQTPERFAAVMAPKVKGGWNLHELTQRDPLDFFVLFSSGASLLGSPGQSNYAAANGFLDGLAAYRAAQGLPGLAINWGSWAEVGMAAGVGADHHRRWSAMGLEMITPESGMQMIGDLLAEGATSQVAAVPLVRSRLPATVGPFYGALVVNRVAATEQEAAPVSILADLRAAAPEDRRGLLDAMLADQVLRVLALPAGQKVDPHESLLNLGLDSLMAMELRNRLQATVGVRVAVADLLEGASLTDLGKMVMGELVFGEDAAASPAKDQEVEWEEGSL